MAPEGVAQGMVECHKVDSEIETDLLEVAIATGMAPLGVVQEAGQETCPEMTGLPETEVLGDQCQGMMDQEVHQ